MSLRTAWVIYRKEILDLLRDRRTLISMVVLPLLVMPLLIGGLSYFMARTERKARETAHPIAVRREIPLSGLLEALSDAGLVPEEAPEPRTAVSEKRAEAGVEVAGSEAQPRVKIYLDRTRTTSEVAANRVELALNRLKEQRVREGLHSMGVSSEVLTPFAVEKVNIATPKRMAGFFLGTLLGYLMVLLMLTGGTYPAIDMTAGEKERRTLEILLAAPASREEVVLGKMGATITAVFVTAILTVTSFGVTFALGARVAEFRAVTSQLPVDVPAVLLILVTLFPLSVLFASILLALSLTARSYKEAQSYLTPLMFLVIMLAMVSTLPGVELGPRLAVIPVLNASQLIKEILMGAASPVTIAVTFGANLAYATGAFLYAVWMFKRESVLFRI
ncbi:MAG: ABC transporter permease [Gemmatimonadetes bacterium]|nr:ABC transporter permease [Gemmatimonadota bacterium]